MLTSSPETCFVAGIMSPENPPDQPDTPPSTVIPPRPWGFWATIGWSLIIAIAYLGVQFFVGIIIAIVSKDIASLDPEEFATNGMLLAIMTCFAAPVVVGLCVLFASLRKQYPLKDYLGFNRPATRTIRR